MGIKVTTKGNFRNMERFLSNAKKMDSHILTILERYGQIGVDMLSAATPVDTGLAASSWYYEIEESKKGYILHWCNSDIENGINVALLIQLGHGTKSGGYVPPVDYINPALRDIFDQLELEVWREVTK